MDHVTQTQVQPTGGAGPGSRYRRAQAVRARAGCRAGPTNLTYLAPLDFYSTYDRRKFSDWITRMNYYFNLYELSDARNIWFATCKLKFTALDVGLP